MKTLYTCLLMIGTLAVNAQQDSIPNGGLEDWASKPGGYSEPVNWFTLNSLKQFGFPETTTQTNEAHTGSSGARLESKSNPLQDLTGLLTSGNIISAGGEPDFSGAKIPFSSRPKSFVFHYKYAPAMGDSCGGVMVLTKWNLANQQADTIATAEFTTGATVNFYTKVTVDFDYLLPMDPDSAMYLFSSSFDGFNPTVGSVMFVDDVSLAYETTGLFDAAVNQIKLDVYPNPANDKLFISTEETNYTVTITDITGKTVMNVKHTGSTNTELNISELHNGLYFVQVESRKGSATQKLIVR